MSFFDTLVSEWDSSQGQYYQPIYYVFIGCYFVSLLGFCCHTFLTCRESNSDEVCVAEYDDYASQVNSHYSNYHQFKHVRNPTHPSESQHFIQNTSSMTSPEVNTANRPVATTELNQSSSLASKKSVARRKKNFDINQFESDEEVLEINAATNKDKFGSMNRASNKSVKRRRDVHLQQLDDEFESDD